MPKLLATIAVANVDLSAHEELKDMSRACNLYPLIGLNASEILADASFKVFFGFY